MNRGSAHPDPGQYESMTCGICGAKMDVERDVVGPRSWAGFKAKQHVKHDFFSCPHRAEDWHKQADALQFMADETPSPTLRRIYNKDLYTVLLKREKI